jgi:membrane protein
MQWIQVRRAFGGVVDDVTRNHTMAFAAGLSYYFVLSLFPLLIMASALVAYLPIPDLFNRILAVMSQVVPADSMGLIRKIVSDVIGAHHGGILTLGLVATIWSASSGFASMIEALNVAYDVPETRPYWHTRPLAIGLTFLIGLLMVVALGVMVVGPQFGAWLAGKLDLGPVFVAVWPYLRWSVAVAFTVGAVEVLYFVGPNVKQSFWRTLPGAAVAVGGWIGLSFLLGLYFRSFANLNKTYGTLGAGIALFVWFYWTALVILIGAELNSELIQQVTGGRLPLKKPPPTFVKPQPPTEADMAA